MNNIILIGMPGSGKSTIGVILAKTMGKSFLDTDLTIQDTCGMLLQEIVDQYGIDKFIKIEEEILLGIEVSNTVISPGGSAVYSEKAMQHLKSGGKAIYIKLPISTISSRLKNITTRGIAMHKGETLEFLYNQRVPLYEKYADIIIDAENKDIEAVVSEIIEGMKRIGK